jgi:hypothetical protein
MQQQALDTAAPGAIGRSFAAVFSIGAAGNPSEGSYVSALSFLHYGSTKGKSFLSKHSAE